MFDPIRAAYNAGYSTYLTGAISNPYNDEPYHAVAQAWDDGFLDAVARKFNAYFIADLFESAFGEPINPSWEAQFNKLTPVEQVDNILQLFQYASKRKG